MRLTAEIHYAADPSTAFEMLADPDFQDRKCVATGAVERDVEVTDYEDGGARVWTSRTLSTEGVTSVIRSVIGDTITVLETQEWDAADDDGARAGTISVEIPGAPVQLTGVLRLEPDGEGCIETIDADLKASVPLIGGKVEQAVEPALRAAIRAEERTGHEWLAELDTESATGE